uniref:GPALPP motifs-containing protein 1 n=1 Tax=Leptobrachium leishanense TaxID=445787 RepID=A0A8C5Q6W9_9ANUR
MSRNVIGPALPPGFSNPEEQESPEESEIAGPVLPPGYTRTRSSDSSDSEHEGKPNPWHDKRGSEERETNSRNQPQPSVADEENDDDGFFGPALPPGFKKAADSPERPVIGPALPPGFKKDLDDGNSPDHGASSNPSAIMEQEESSEDEAIVGPVPAEGPVTSSVAEEFERRALKMKQKLTASDDDGSKKTTRESWMTELPPEMTVFGLGPRSFKRKTNEKSGDRSIWTDTPADQERKAREKQEAKVSSSKEEKAPLSERDKHLAEQVSIHNDTKRSKSLLDLHRKKLKRKAEEDKNKSQERRPFDRDQDLQVNRFDDAQKKALIAGGDCRDHRGSARRAG